MPDTPSGYHSRRYDYFHPQHRRSRGGALARSRGRCQGCGYGLAKHAHHWQLRYLPPWETTSDHLTALCCVCHRVMTLLRRFLSVGGAPARFLAILEAALVEASETVPRTGRALLLRGGYGARVAGRTRPQVGELLQVTLRSGAWVTMRVSAVVGHYRGRWYVLTSWPKASERCANRAADAAAGGVGGRTASGRRQSGGRRVCA